MPHLMSMKWRPYANLYRTPDPKIPLNHSKGACDVIVSFKEYERRYMDSDEDEPRVEEDNTTDTDEEENEDVESEELDDEEDDPSEDYKVTKNDLTSNPETSATKFEVKNEIRDPIRNNLLTGEMNRLRESLLKFLEINLFLLIIFIHHIHTKI